MAIDTGGFAPRHPEQCEEAGLRNRRSALGDGTHPSMTAWPQAKTSEPMPSLLVCKSEVKQHPAHTVVVECKQTPVKCFKGRWLSSVSPNVGMTGAEARQPPFPGNGAATGRAQPGLGPPDPSSPPPHPAAKVHPLVPCCGLSLPCHPWLSSRHILPGLSSCPASSR